MRSLPPPDPSRPRLKPPRNRERRRVSDSSARAPSGRFVVFIVVAPVVVISDFDSVGQAALFELTFRDLVPCDNADNDEDRFDEDEDDAEK